MDWITDSIVIGSYNDSQHVSEVRKARVQSILRLIQANKGADRDELGLQRLAVVPLIDGPGNDERCLRAAIDTLARLVEEMPPVLVHCRAGISRAPTVVAGYLVKYEGMKLRNAFGLIRSKRQINVHGGLRESLKELLAKER
ncbi:MAG: dual specificity protein phosphatase family protein [Gemmataceae bacterium]